MTKHQIIEQLNRMPENSRVIWMLEKIEEIRNDFEEAENILTDRVERLVEDVLKNDLGLDKDILEWAMVGKRYSEWLQRFKGKIIIDEGIAMGEATELLKIAKCEIQTLRRNINSAKRSTTLVKDDIAKMRKQLYVHLKLDEMKLDNPTKYRVKQILLEGDGLKILTEYEINKKIKMLLED